VGTKSPSSVEAKKIMPKVKRFCLERNPVVGSGPEATRSGVLLEWSDSGALLKRQPSGSRGLTTDGRKLTSVVLVCQKNLAEGLKKRESGQETKNPSGEIGR
jgi:hypothetical protein